MSEQTQYNSQDQVGELLENIKELNSITKEYADNSFVDNSKEYFSSQVYADFLRTYIDDESIVAMLAPYMQYFQPKLISRLVGYVQGNEENLSTDDRRDLHSAFSVFSDKTTELETLYAVDYIRRIFVDNQKYFFDIIQPGEDIELALTLEEGEDWSDKILAARLDIDNSLLSDGTTMGQPQTVEPIQKLDLGNIALPANTLHKILLTLEEESGGVTTGERIKVIGHYFLVVQDLNALVP